MNLLFALENYAQSASPAYEREDGPTPHHLAKPCHKLSRIRKILILHAGRFKCVQHLPASFSTCREESGHPPSLFVHLLNVQLGDIRFLPVVKLDLRGRGQAGGGHHLAYSFVQRKPVEWIL